jgi:hypothetical protein
MSATTMVAASTAEKAGWGTRALAILIDGIGVGTLILDGTSRKRAGKKGP